ncbi:hypothetical protein BDZ94DRAFT_1318375 [Collybia nuda]|uniref:Flavin-containing monooxygenase n=1 Tax=Collybia nuda TaxID=64659 RepID=A0A9P5YD71_9AGAR|nr:hypothetical protein BDZ94DRAFT_1318375 [Collybia nuda]
MESSGGFTQTIHQKNAKTICIIGAGAAGLISLKTILDTHQYKSGEWKPTVYESRDRIGGTWVPSPPSDNPPLTALYDSLTTNLPHPIMALPDHPFPPSTAVFPCASVVQKYLENYADQFSLASHIQVSTNVNNIEWDGHRWKVTLSTGQGPHFDLVIVCNGHYRIPRYPSIPGIKEWLNARRASHAAWYRRPYDLGRTILIVGGGPSGQDISADMRETTTTVIHSVTGAIPEDIGNLKRRGRVTEFRNGGEVLFEDGTIESGVDFCILATGYEFSFPFMSDSLIHSGYPSTIPPLPRNLFNSTHHLFPLAKHIFPLQTMFPPTSIAFMGLLTMGSAFPVMDAQAQAIVQAFANPHILDPTQEMINIFSRYEKLYSQSTDPVSIAKNWHKVKPREQFNYRDDLYRFSAASGIIKFREVPEWQKEAYDNRDILRKAWVEVVRRGEADTWVKGVGEGGPHEWIDLLNRLQQWAQESLHIPQPSLERHVLQREVNMTT